MCSVSVKLRLPYSPKSRNRARWVAQNFIANVDKPTDWVSNLVTVGNKSGVPRLQTCQPGECF